MFDHVHIIGSGIMGTDIAISCILNNFQVSLADIDYQKLGQSYKKIVSVLNDKLPSHEVDNKLNNLTLDINNYGLSKAGIIIEAVTENLPLKQKILSYAKKESNGILVTNTSSIKFTEISKNMQNPQNLIGLHFFNPVNITPVVEIVSNSYTDKNVIEQSYNFVRKIKLIPIHVKNSPGFLINRILIPYLLEAFMLYTEGCCINDIDQSAKKFGMLIGPIEFADTIGLDVCKDIITELSKNHAIEIPNTLIKMVKDNKLGKKNNQGFYNYDNKGKKIVSSYKKYWPFNKKEVNKITNLYLLKDRLIMRLLNESIACLNENIVDNHDTIDMAMILGIGFPAFTGGPINYTNNNKKIVLNKIKNLYEEYGERFYPHPGWSNL